MTIRMSVRRQSSPFSGILDIKKEKIRAHDTRITYWSQRYVSIYFWRHKMDFFEAVVRSVIVVVKIMQCSVEASAFLYETMLLLSSTFAVT